MHPHGVSVLVLVSAETCFHLREAQTVQEVMEEIPAAVYGGQLFISSRGSSVSTGRLKLRWVQRAAVVLSDAQH